MFDKANSTYTLIKCTSKNYSTTESTFYFVT